MRLGVKAFHFLSPVEPGPGRTRLKEEGGGRGSRSVSKVAGGGWGVMGELVAGTRDTDVGWGK